MDCPSRKRGEDMSPSHSKTLRGRGGPLTQLLLGSEDKYKVKRGEDDG